MWFVNANNARGSCINSLKHFLHILGAKIYTPNFPHLSHLNIFVYLFFAFILLFVPSQVAFVFKRASLADKAFVAVLFRAEAKWNFHHFDCLCIARPILKLAASTAALFIAMPK